MRFLARALSVFLIWGLSLVGGFAAPSLARATQDEFATDLETVYTIDDQGRTQVEHHFTLTNLSPDLYISKYAYQTSLTSLEAITIKSENQSLAPQVVVTPEKTTISFSFPDALVGEGKARHFTIAYRSAVFSAQTGEVLEVTLPALTSQADYRSHHLELRVARRFGAPYRLQPQPSQTSQTKTENRYRFENYSGVAITATYGERQSYRLQASYYLHNPLQKRAYTELALPPETARQVIHYQTLHPRPETMRIDADGNWLAGYYLDPLTTLLVQAEAIITLSLNPDPTFPEPPPLPSHLAPQPYWELPKEQLRHLAGLNPSAYSLYQTTLNTLQYSTRPLSADRLRYGALGALQQPNDAVCQEFTDLFIALARGHQIPARRATGYAFTNQPQLRPLNLQGDILHTWPEYFDAERQRWQPIDPTWESTTGGVDYFHYFDLNHLTFAYNGEESSQPVPAGGYPPPETKQAKTLTVTLTEEPALSKPHFSLTVEPLRVGWLTLPGWYNLSIENDSGKAWYGARVEEGSQKGAPLTFLPFMRHRQKTLLTTERWWPEWRPLTLAIHLAQAPTQYVESQQSYLALPSYLVDYRFYLALGLGFGGLTLGTGSVLVFRRRRHSSLRGQSQAS